MAQVDKTTLTLKYTETDEFNTPPVRTAMESFCNETVRLINWTLKKEAADPEKFEAEVSYAWFQVPEEPGLYNVQVIGPHTHQSVRGIGEKLQSDVEEIGHPIEIYVLRG